VKRSPQRGPGQSQGVRGQSPSEDESFEAFAHLKRRPKNCCQYAKPITGSGVELPEVFRSRAPAERSGAKTPEAESYEAFAHLNRRPKNCCQYAKPIT